MFASFRAELLKLRKRASTWVIAVILTLSVILFSYLLGYVLIVGLGPNRPPDAAELLTSLYPREFPREVLGVIGNLGPAVALIFGALIAGGEYGWDTIKLSLTQRPGRLTFLAGRLLALGAVLAAMIFSTFLVGALCSFAVAAVEGTAVSLPTAGETLRTFGAGWLILATFAALGFSLATLFRGTVWAVALGLVYLLVAENAILVVVLTVPAVQEGPILAASRAPPGRNSGALISSFGETPEEFLPPGGLIDPLQATLVLFAYALVSLLLAALLFKRQDVD